MMFKSSDGRWYRIAQADMAHKTDAVAYWNKTGGFHGAKSKEVRAWMLDPDNYELQFNSHNRSLGAKLGIKYQNADEFIGPAEKSQYF